MKYRRLFILCGATLVAFAGAGSFARSAHAALAHSAASVADYIFIDGFDGPVDCSAALVCDVPVSGKACISGRLTDAGSAAQLRALFKADRTCNDGAAGGPCDLSVTAYDAVAYASDPASSTPLASGETTIDGCGRFRLANLTPPTTQFVTIVTDDAVAMPDDHVASATSRPLAANGRVDDVSALATRRDTVAAWTESAGSPYGASSFADVGVILFGFEIGSVPRAGVSVIRNGSAVTGSDFYFADASAQQRLAIDATLGTTGVNGAALFANAPGFATYSGTGAEPVGCVWPSVMSTSIAGAVVFVEINVNCP